MSLLQKNGISMYLRNFADNLQFYISTFFIQYEKILFYRFYSEYDTESETNEDYENGSDFDEEWVNQEEESEEEKKEQLEEDSEGKFCRENCHCKLCSYFKDIIEMAYHKIKDL
jgi:hypothetical protein